MNARRGAALLNTTPHFVQLLRPGAALDGPGVILKGNVEAVDLPRNEVGRRGQVDGLGVFRSRQRVPAGPARTNASPWRVMTL